MTTSPGLSPGSRMPPHDHHRNVAGGPLRPALFGAMDGLMSNTSLIAGVAGGGASSGTVLLTGLAGLTAGAFSMAVGEYTSVRAQQEATLAEIALERLELRRSPASERAELAQTYTDRGLSPELAAEVAHQLMAHPDTALRVHTQEELGVDIDRLPSPWVAAVSSIVSFAVGAFVPVLPYAVSVPHLWISLLLSGIALFLAGAFVSRYSPRSFVYAGLRPLLLGGVATAVTYGIGQAVGTGIS